MPLNTKALKTIVAKQASRTLVKQVRPIVKLDFETKKEQFLEEFDQNSITQELRDGPRAFSQIPELAEAGGNLFSLLGFYAEQKPVESLREYLEDNIVLYKTGAGKVKGGKVIFETQIIAPTEEDINQAISIDTQSNLEWTERPYTDLLARGVGGLPNYIFDLTRDFSSIPSRSGPAIESSNKLRNTNLRPIPYVKELLKSLSRRMIGK